MDSKQALEILSKRLKARGLDVAEDAVKVLVEEVFGSVEEIIKLSENKYDDMLLLALPKAQQVLLGYADKIDGKVG